MVRALQISEARLRLEGAGAAQPVWIANRTGRMVYVNERWRAYFGVRTAPDSWQKWLELIEPGDAQAVVHRLRTGLRGGEPFRLDCRFRRYDGSYRWHQINALPLQDGSGSAARFFGVHTDIHDLKECDARVGAALEAANTGVWEWQIESDAVTWTPRCYEIHGLSEVEFRGTGAAFFQLVHEEDRERVSLALQTALEKRALYECEFRVVRPSGRVIWVENLGRASYDARGRPISVQGTLTDIDQRKRAEEAQRARERALQTLADHSPDIISRFDRNLRHVFINAAVERVTGQPRTAFLGKTNRDLGMPPELCEHWERALVRVFEAGEPEQIEFSVPTLQGERHFCSRLVAERAPDGRVESVLVIANDITDCRRAERALRLSEERLQRAQRAAHIGTWDWNIVTGEASWTLESWHLFGHEPFSCPVTFELWLGSVHPEDRESAAEDVRAGHRTGHYHSEFRVVYRDGWSRRLEADGEVVLVEGEPVRMIGTVRDITARHEAEQGLRNANQKLVAARDRALLKRDIVAKVAGASSSVQIVEVFAEGLLQLGSLGVASWEVAPSGATLLLERGTPVGREPLAHPTDDVPPAVFECVRLGASIWGESYPDGTRARHPSPSYHPLIQSPSAAIVIAVTHDSDPDDEQQAALEQLCGQVAEALRRAALGTRLMEQTTADRRLMAIVSHDLRNPLNTIALAASLISSNTAPHDPSLVQRIDRSTRTATSLVNDLLTFTRIDAAGLELRLAPVRLFQLLQGCVSDASLRATGGRSVVLELDAADDPTLMVDAARIEQAVGNLVSNALSYSPKDSAVVVRGSADRHAFYLEVENRGSRIEPEDAGKIFEPLTRLAAIGENGSLGLGLFIVDRIVDAHQGRVWVESFQPDGVRFCVQLPRARTRETESSVSLSSRKSSQPPPAAAALDPDLERLASNFQARELRAVLELWAAGRKGSAMPHPFALERERLRPYLPDTVMVDVALDLLKNPVFRWGQVGARLERRLHGTLTGTQLQLLDSSFGAPQYAAYRRAWELRECAYDYVRQRRAASFNFERLLLPLSRDGGRNVTQILGIIVFR